MALTFIILVLRDNGVTISGIRTWLITTSTTPFSVADIIPPSHPPLQILGHNPEQHLSTPVTAIPVGQKVPSGLSDVEAPSPANPIPLVFGTGAAAFTPDDVVILFKTGATSLWHRVPIHLTTTLANKTITPNVVIYSDQADNLGDFSVVDALANISDTLKANPDFELYHALKTISGNHYYLETTAMGGDHYIPGGWRLDKYKFLPMMAHAALTRPNKKWYIYMEDDNYYFWRSLYNWLSTFDPSTPLFLGSPASRLGEDFAHGGSGFMISGAAMSQTFGSNPNLAHEYESYAQERCCGDQILSHVMAESGVARDRRYDRTGWAGLQGLPHWLMKFGHWNWCSPLFNVHKVHQADVSRFYLLEKQFQAGHGINKIMTWGSLFHLTLASSMTKARVHEWDNYANEQWHCSTEADQLLSTEERGRKPWFSADACERACEEWSMCLSWKYADDICGLGATVGSGNPVKEGIAMTSGFHLERIRALMEKQCQPLGYGE